MTGRDYRRASVEPWFHCWVELVLLDKAQRPVVWFCTVKMSLCFCCSVVGRSAPIQAIIIVDKLFYEVLDKIIYTQRD